MANASTPSAKNPSLLPALDAALAASTTFAGNQSLTRESLFQNLVFTKELESNRDLWRRIFLLDRAFKKEGCLEAREAYLNWLFGRVDGKFGFNDADHPYKEIDFHLFAGTSTMTRLNKQASQQAKTLIADIQSNTDTLKAIRIAANQRLAMKPQPGKYLLSSLNKNTKPGFYLNDSVSLKVYQSIALEWNDSLEESSPDFVDQMAYLFNGMKKGSLIPDIAATLGSFSVYLYVDAHLVVKENNQHEILIEQWGKRIVDGYNFRQSSTLGWWYPEQGHVTFKGRPLRDEDFEEFRKNVAPLINDQLRNKHPKLECLDYKIKSNMVVEALPDNEKVRFPLPGGNP